MDRGVVLFIDRRVPRACSSFFSRWGVCPSFLLRLGSFRFVSMFLFLSRRPHGERRLSQRRTATTPRRRRAKDETRRVVTTTTTTTAAQRKDRGGGVGLSCLSTAAVVSCSRALAPRSPEAPGGSGFAALDFATPSRLPDQLRAEQWAFVTLPLAEVALRGGGGDGQMMAPCEPLFPKPSSF